MEGVKDFQISQVGHDWAQWFIILTISHRLAYIHLLLIQWSLTVCTYVFQAKWKLWGGHCGTARWWVWRLLHQHIQDKHYNKVNYILKKMALIKVRMLIC